MSNGSKTDNTPIRKTNRSTVRRFAPRGSYDRNVLNSILDECLVAHVGFNHEGHPSVLPMAFWRVDDYVYFHGAARNRMISDLAKDDECCFVVSTIDALVLARAAMHHSINYRCVIIYGKPEEVIDTDAKLSAMKTFIERVYPGRWNDIRSPTDIELRAVRVMRLHIDEASAKIRAEQPTYYPGDAHLPVWAGVVPFKISAGTPVPDPSVPESILVPAHALHYHHILEAASA